MPPAEYETQVLRIPGEEHLSHFNWRQRPRGGKRLHTCIEQVGPLGAVPMEEWCVWSMFRVREGVRARVWSNWR